MNASSNKSSSYTYQTSSKKHCSIEAESERLKYIVKQIEQILDHSLYKNESKIDLCKKIIQENKQ